MPLGADDVQTASGQHFVMQRLPAATQLGDATILLGLIDVGHGLHHFHLPLDAATEHDVGAATGHVGGDGHHLRPAGLGHDLGLACMLLGIEHLMRQADFFQQRRQQLGVLDRGGAHQHRLTAAIAILDVADDGLVLLLHRAINLIVVILAHHRPVGRQHHRFQAVDLLELIGFGISRAGHASELAVHTEIILERDRGEGLVLALNVHTFLGLDPLMQAIGPAPTRHQTTGELIHDHYFAVLHHVVTILEEEMVRTQCLRQLMDQADEHRLIQAAALG